MHLRELIRFSKFTSVGLIATSVNALIFTFFYSIYGVNIVLANILAFFCAVGISYLGHHYLTFRDISGNAKQKFTFYLRFLFTALTSLGLNIFFAYLIITVLNWHLLVYTLGAVYLVTPGCTYLLYRLWVYKQ